MRIWEQIMRELSQPGEVRQHIKNLLADQGDSLDAASISRLFETYPEHADLLLLLSIGMRENVAAVGLKAYSSRAVAQLVEGGFFEPASELLAEGIKSRLSLNEKILLPVIAQYLVAGLLTVEDCASVVKHPQELMVRLCSARANTELLVKFCKVLEEIGEDTPDLETLRPHLAQDAYSSLLLRVTESLKHEDQIRSLSREIESNYSSALARALWELETPGLGHAITKLSVKALVAVFRDNDFTETEKNLIITLMPAEELEALVSADRENLEYRSLALSVVWPSEKLSNTQVAILNKLGNEPEEQKIRELFLSAIKDGELLLDPDSLKALSNEGLYRDIMRVVGKIIREEGSQSYLPSETIDAILEAKIHPMPAEFFILVLKFNKDWTKLDLTERMDLIYYAIAERPEAFTPKKDKASTQILLKGKVVGTIEDGNLSLGHSLNQLSPEAKDFLYRVGTIGLTLPHTIVGSYHLKTNIFKPDDDSIPVNKLNLIINFDRATIEGLNKISENIVMQDLKALQRGSQGSIVFVLELEQHDVLETIAQSADVIERAKKLHRKIKKVKKNTVDLLETMSLIAEDDNRKFGVELEIASQIPRAELAKKLGRGTTSRDDNSSEDGWNNWAIKFDISVGGEYSVDERDKELLTEREVRAKIIENGGFSAELVSPVLQGREGIEDLRRVLKRLNQIMKRDKVGLGVGREIDTGLHVHHSIEDLIKKVGSIERDSETALAMGKYLMSVQGALYALCSKWRLNSIHARPLKSAAELKGDYRYGFAISSYGTLEYRLKEATFNDDAIVRWVILTQQITMSLIETVNNDISDAKKRLKEALEGGIDMILAQEFDEAGEHKDLLSHLAYYQAATDFAMAA